MGVGGGREVGVEGEEAVEGRGLGRHGWRVYWVVAAVLIVWGAIIVGELRL